MASVLNTNVASLWASKNLQGAQSKMADSVERLSSGLRINRAKDDAAGLGIANSLTQQINGANQGVRNLNDGISMVQTAEGAIAAAQEMAQRILTLATQGANGTVGTTERTAIQNEMKQLLMAINTIGTRTKFSGNSLLNNDARTGAGNDAAAAAPPTTEKFSLQVSNTTTDKISLAAAAFLNIGGNYGAVTSETAANTDAATAVTFTVGSALSSSIIGTTVYTKTAAGAYASVGTVASLAANGTDVTLSAGATPLLTGKTVVFSGQLTQKFSSTANDLSLTEAIGASSLVNDTAATAVAGFQMVQRAVDGYIGALSTQRSLLGAYQHQIEFCIYLKKEYLAE